MTRSRIGRLAAAVTVALALQTAPAYAAPPKPTIANGGLPFGTVDKKIGGVWYRCQMFRNPRGGDAILKNCVRIYSENFGLNWWVTGGISNTLWW